MGSQSLNSSSTVGPSIDTNTNTKTSSSMQLTGLSVSRHARGGVFLLLLACFLHGLALSVPVWESDHGDSYSSLWWVCLGSRCISTVKISMKVWFHAVQVLMVSCAVTLIAGLIALGVHIFHPTLEKKKRRTATATFFIVLGAGIQALLAVILYGFGQVPNPDYFYTLSWGFYMALLGSIFMFLSSIFFFKESNRLASCAADKRPILRHSQSMTSEICFSLKTAPTVYTPRTRSESEVRLRAPSLSCSPSTPIPADDNSLNVGFKGITEVFSPQFPP